ncbi:MAG: peptidylprolyl isomerase, partial [Gracilimonas sp.]|nr:peptidylprolyl isomerase [Gracilimonas sp.]
GRTVKPFEDTIYDLEVGEISEPFRTQFGYHIALLQDKRERTPARLTSHIYVRGSDSTSYAKISDAYSALESGTAWGKAVSQYSEDGASIRNNGRIGWVSYQSNFAMEFVDAIVNLDPEEDYSEPVTTNYGYHIFKVDSVESYATEDDRNKALMEDLKDSPYYEENNQFVLNYLSENFGSELNNTSLQKYEAWLIGQDTTMIKDLSFPTSLADESIYTLGSNTYTTADFHTYLKNRYDQRIARTYAEDWFNNFKDFAADNSIIELTLERYPAFEEQSQNYLNGLVVYNINEDNIWSAATVDSSRLQNMYEDNIQNYQYEERPFYYLLTARHDSTLEKAKSFVLNGGSPDSLRNQILNLGVSSDSTSEYSEPPFDRLMNMDTKSFSENFEYNNRKAVFWLQEILPARTMSFKEAFNRLLSEFQPQREKEWLEELRSTYNVNANMKNLREAYQKDS